MKKVKLIGMAVICLAWLSVSSGIAYAKDICVTVGPGEAYYVFSKAKVPKPGTAVPLAGVYYFAGSSFAAPVIGTAYMTAAGTVNIGVFVHTMNPILTVNFTVTIKGANARFEGSGKTDENGDYIADNDITWITVDCQTLTLP